MKIFNLKIALENLETFSHHIENENEWGMPNFEVKEGKLVATPQSSLKKTISLALHNLIQSDFKDSKPVIEEILYSSTVVRNYFPLILTMERGSTEEQRFAASAKAAVARFNLAVEQLEAVSVNWKQKLVRFLCGEKGLFVAGRLLKIDVPKKTSLQIEFPRREGAQSKTFFTTSEHAKTDFEALQKISTLQGSLLPAVMLERQTLELYRMKVIASLQRHKLFSVVEARSIVLKTPVKTLFNQEAQTLEISQLLIPIPGHKVKAAILLRKDPKGSIFNIVLNDHLSVEITQTGFPHPSQHHGFALPEVLIPKCLTSEHSKLCSRFSTLSAQKQKIAEELLPGGRLEEKAKKLHTMKSSLFHEHRNEFLQAHRLLAQTIAAATPFESEKLNFKRIANNFFCFLATHPQPYELLSNTYERLMTGIAGIPYTALESSWVKDQLGSLEEAEQLLQSSIEATQERWQQQLAIENFLAEEEKQSVMFCLAMSHFFSGAIKQITLAQYANLFGEKTPPFDLFTQKVQLALYAQLWEFQLELSMNVEEMDMFCRISRLLEEEIALFGAAQLPDFDSDALSVVLELAEHYS